MLQGYIQREGEAIVTDKRSTSSPRARYSDLVGKPVVIVPIKPDDIPIPHCPGDTSFVSVALSCPTVRKEGRKKIKDGALLLLQTFTRLNVLVKR